MKTVIASLLSVLLAACATAPPIERPEHLFKDNLFAVSSEPVSVEAVFALNDSMRRYIATNIGGKVKSANRQRDLFEALYSKSKLKLEYESTMTRNAAQAFDARSGNCLSLVIMTAAFAKALGLPVRYQNAMVEDSWSRSSGIYFASGHVNLSLGKRPSDAQATYDEADWLQIDFVPTQYGRARRLRIIGEETVVAMYMNNRAAESLERGQLDDAYWWARHAIGQDPRFLSAYNTLGVIYRHHGNLAEAEQVLKFVLAREPANANTTSNLIVVYNDQGRFAEAAALNRRLEQIWPDRPFQYFDQGLAAMQAGDYRMAKEMFAREVRRDPYYHEFNFWLARALLSLGEIKQADRYLAIAAEYSPTRADHDLYAAKLDRLRAIQAQ